LTNSAHRKKESFMIKTFGCKTNRADSEKIISALRGEGWSLAGDDISLCIVNSCCVTARSENKALKTAQALKKNHPSAEVVLSGCVTDSLKVAALESCIGIKLKYPPVSASAPTEGRQRYFLKIQNGCDNFCSYCIVPALRGAPASRSRENIMRELECLENAAAFPSELVLTGTNINLYKDPGGGLMDLIYTIRKRYKARIRLGSLEPPFEEGFVKKLSRAANICPHFPVPLQSGSNSVLKKMRRKYSASDFMKTLDEIRKYFDKAAVTTDIIYGFPGESDDDFNETLDFVAQAQFSKIHVFPFSARPGTLAALYPPLKHSVIKERKARLLEAAAKSSEDYRRKFIGQSLEVVAETKTGEWFYGTSGNYLKVKFPAGKALSGDIVRVEVEGTLGGFMNGAAAETLWTANR